jgi:eukaryotic-like serine/threonine-protein kinase
MTAPRPNNEAIFHAARDIPEPECRRDYVREACDGDETRIAHVEAMLAAADAPDSLLDRPAGHAALATIDPPRGECVGSVIGPYKLLQQIGEEGMGTVWMAQQTEPVKRVVALKLIKAGMDSRQVIARFEAERQALALMDHANIARVLDAGTTGAGRPYFVMDLVKGVPITKYCDEHHLTPRQRLELFIPVCQAIQHAHQKGIIHRDLKPSNVLIALYDGKPAPKVIDFGVAKATGQQLTEKTLVTGFGAIVGTLEYMSPEQAEVNQLDIDTRSDIYSLGVLLYELLTGSPPFSRKDLEKAGMLEMLRVIREQEPSKPSTKLSTAEGLPSLAANRGTEPAKLTKLVRGELDWIVMKALEKDRNRRYETAYGLAMDVHRYLADEPVLAGPPSAWYRFRKFARRNKAKLAVAGLCLFFALWLVGGALWYVQDRIQRQAGIQKQQALNVERVRNRLEQARQIRADLHRMLDDPTGLNRLLNDPAFWQARIDLALGEWKEARLLQIVVPIEPALQVQMDELERDLQQEQQHRQRALALEKAREEHAVMVEGKFNFAGALKKYRDAFAQSGLDVDKHTPFELAQAIRRSPLRRQFLAALDDFAHVAWTEEVTTLHEHLLSTARLVDPDPLRDRLRDPKLMQDRAAVEILARELLDKPKSLVDLSAQTLDVLGTLLPRGSLQERWLRQAHRLHPDDFWLAFGLGEALYMTKKYPEAAAYFGAALGLRPRNAVAWSNLGVILRANNDLPAAIDAHKKALATDPNLASAWNNLGATLYQSKDVPAAIDAFEKSLAIDKHNVLAWTNLGAALLESKDLPAAIDAYRKALAIDKQFAPAWYDLGCALRASKDLPAAIDALKKALAIDNQHAQAWNNLGLSLADSNDLPAAMDAYRKALAIDPNFAAAWNNLGNALYISKDLPAAIDAHKKALAIDPDLAEAWTNLGAVLYINKDLPAAIDAYRKALAIDKQDAATWSSKTGPRRRLSTPPAPSRSLKRTATSPASSAMKTGSRLKWKTPASATPGNTTSGRISGSCPRPPSGIPISSSAGRTPNCSTPGLAKRTPGPDSTSGRTRTTAGTQPFASPPMITTAKVSADTVLGITDNSLAWCQKHRATQTYE